MLRLLLILHLVICFRQGLTQKKRIDMCVENLNSFPNRSFVLYANGGSQCRARTCSCSVTIRNSCSPARFYLTSDKQSNGCNCTRTMYNDTLVYRQNNVSDTLLWNETYYMEADAIRNVPETFSMIATYSGCSPNYELTIWTNGSCDSQYRNFTVNCTSTMMTTTTTTMMTTTRRANASFTTGVWSTATQRTTSDLSSTDLQERAVSKSSSKIKNNEMSPETGLIVGLVVGVGGGLILLIVVIVIVVIISRRRSTEDQRENASVKRTVSIPNPYEMPPAHTAVTAVAAANGRINSHYPPLNDPPQYETIASNNSTHSQNIGSVGDHNQDDSYDNFYGRNNEALSSSDATDYYNADAVVNDNGMTVDNNEVTVVENSLYK